MKKLVLSALLALMLLSACTHKSLCYDHPHTAPLRVEFDWTLAPDASPASMSVYLFDMEQPGGLRYDFTDHLGGTVRVPRGPYRALSLNSDTEVVTYRNTDLWETFEVTTPGVEQLPGLSGVGVAVSSLPGVSSSSDERLAAVPDALWSTRSDPFEITELGDTLSLQPVRSVCNYTVDIVDVENLADVSALAATLSGLSGGWLVGPGKPSDEHVTLPFELFQASSDSLTGEFCAFGPCLSDECTHTLVVYAILTDGSKWYYTYDVADQIHSAADPWNVHLLLKGLPLPEAETGGFNPSVDDWQELHVDIEM